MKNQEYSYEIQIAFNKFSWALPRCLIQNYTSYIFAIFTKHNTLSNMYSLIRLYGQPDIWYPTKLLAEYPAK